MVTDSNDSHENMGRNASLERTATTANQGSVMCSNTSFPPISGQYYGEQPLCVPQIFVEGCLVVVPVPMPCSYPSTSGSYSFCLQQHPLPPIHGGNYNLDQHFHHPLNHYRNYRGSEYQGLTFSHGAYGFQVPMFENGIPPHTQAFGYYTDQRSHGNHQQHQHFSPTSQTRGYDNNSGVVHGDNSCSNRLPRRRHHHRSRNHNSGRSQNSPAEHLGQIPRVQNTSGGHRQAPRFQSSSPTNMINILQSAASVEIVDEQIIIDQFLRGIDIQDHPMGHQHLPIEEQTNHVGNGLSEDFILRNLRTRTLVGRPISDDEMCTICQDGFEENKRIGTLDCEHVYHADCITQWLKISNLCPLCKRTGLTLYTGADSQFTSQG